MANRPDNPPGVDQESQGNAGHDDDEETQYRGAGSRGQTVGNQAVRHRAVKNAGRAQKRTIGGRGERTLDHLPPSVRPSR